MCEKCLPVLSELSGALLAANGELRKLFPDPAPLLDPDDDEMVPGTDLRVQVHKAQWQIHTGSSQYDQDHRGLWAVSWLPWEPMTPSEVTELAQELIDDLADDLAQGELTDCPFYDKSVRFEEIMDTMSDLVEEALELCSGLESNQRDLARMGWRNAIQTLINGAHSSNEKGSMRETYRQLHKAW